MHKDNFAAAGKNQVRAAGKRAAMKAETIPQPMSQRTYQHLGYGVPAANAGHAATALLGCHYVGHASISSDAGFDQFNESVNVEKRKRAV
jgi:hypothetical protein